MSSSSDECYIVRLETLPGPRDRRARARWAPCCGAWRPTVGRVTMNRTTSSGASRRRRSYQVAECSAGKWCSVALEQEHSDSKDEAFMLELKS